MRAGVIAALLAFALIASAVVRAQEVRTVGAYAVAPSTTVSGLPSCAANLTGVVYVVTNALTPVLGSAVVGGGLISVVVRCNGTNWLVGE